MTTIRHKGDAAFKRHSKWSSLLLVALFLAGCSDGGTFKTRVIEFNCEAGYNDDWSCKKDRVPAAELVFLGNAHSGTVMMRVIENRGGSWGVPSAVYDNCKIVDADNWQCEGGYGNFVSVVGAEYARYNQMAGVGYRVKGVTGWRYWLAKGLLVTGDKKQLRTDFFVGK